MAGTVASQPLPSRRRKASSGVQLSRVLEVLERRADQLLGHEVAAVLQHDVQAGVHRQRRFAGRADQPRLPLVKRFQRPDEQRANDAAGVTLEDDALERDHLPRTDRVLAGGQALEWQDHRDVSSRSLDQPSRSGQPFGGLIAVLVQNERGDFARAFLHERDLGVDDLVEEVGFCFRKDLEAFPCPVSCAKYRFSSRVIGEDEARGQFIPADVPVARLRA